MTNIQMVRLLSGYNRNIKLQKKGQQNASTPGKKAANLKGIGDLANTKGVHVRTSKEKKEFSKKYNDIRRSIYEMRGYKNNKDKKDKKLND